MLWWIVGVIALFIIALLGQVPKYFYLTTESRQDGFGAQYLNIIFTAVTVEHRFKKKFLYRGLRQTAHNYDRDPRFFTRLENMINLSSRFSRHIVSVPVLPNAASYPQTTGELDAILSTSCFQQIKKLFWDKNKPEVRQRKTTIALHIRRPNPEDNLKLFDCPSRRLDDSYFVEILHELQTRYGTEIEVHIYSQGNPDSFQLFPEAILHINEALELTFVGMARADILVMSYSLLSYTAALLQEGLVIYPPSHHYLPPPGSHWLSFPRELNVRPKTNPNEFQQMSSQS